MEHDQSAAMGSGDQYVGEEPELVEGVVVVADVRALDTVRDGPPPFMQVAAVAATGFVAGAATAAVLGRHFSRAQARRVASTPAVTRPQACGPFHVVSSQSFVVDVHTLVRR
jgi:hypothetical protein